ncbi:GNAT family acetyltransferase [Desulfonema ishimotonii]|uniref:GNAT family acetyltransferase n=1 Tax=Desulfonema ishimotonii TaxID=45657 RepID=A0A401FU84_9BACT|nr:GNAT family acetyltransferase [Desulfonema ishimotonii]GBC60515.1 GNAT family acetyltransferase [Desulfonema ishimotonii]
MEIREYRKSDENEVVELWIKCNLTVPWNNPQKDIKRKLQKDRDLFLVGISDGKIIASVMGGYDGHRGWINYLAVDPEYQRKGLARQIMAAAEQRIRGKGCPKINLQVRAANNAVIRFYEAMGYRDDNVISLGKRLEEDGPVSV